jgi:hypothetical protein
MTKQDKAAEEAERLLPCEPNGCLATNNPALGLAAGVRHSPSCPHEYRDAIRRSLRQRDERIAELEAQLSEDGPTMAYRTARLTDELRQQLADAQAENECLKGVLSRMDIDTREAVQGLKTTLARQHNEIDRLTVQLNANCLERDALRLNLRQRDERIARAGGGQEATHGGFGHVATAVRCFRQKMTITVATVYGRQSFPAYQCPRCSFRATSPELVAEHEGIHGRSLSDLDVPRKMKRRCRACGKERPIWTFAGNGRRRHGKFCLYCRRDRRRSSATGFG